MIAFTYIPNIWHRRDVRGSAEQAQWHDALALRPAASEHVACGRVVDYVLLDSASSYKYHH